MRRSWPLLFLLFAGCASLSPTFKTELDGNRIAYAMTGQHSVTVVFEAGLGDGMKTWQPVFKPIASFATVFAYDRPGYGGSDDVSGPRTGRDIVDRLRTILDHVQLSPPYVLVGHSLGGQVVELYARLYPDEVAGVVLVDSRHPDFTGRCEETLGSSECGVPGFLKLVMPGHMKRELAGALETANQIRAAPPFPDIELVVVSRSTGKESKEWLELWAETQREYAQLTSSAVHIVSDESGHYVHKDDSEAVIEALRRLVERVIK